MRGTSKSWEASQPTGIKPADFSSAKESITSNKKPPPSLPLCSSPTNDITPVDGPVFDNDDTVE